MSGAEAIERSVDAYTPVDTPNVSRLLGEVNGSAGRSLVLSLQHMQGNSVVQRLLARTPVGGPPVQRQAPTDDELDAGAQDATMDPIKLHAEIFGVTPDPNDPYEQPATNWDSLAGGAYGPDAPDEWPGVTPAPLAPLPNLRPDGKPAANIELAKQAQVNDALKTFETGLGIAHNSWSALIPAIHTYTDASNGLLGKGMLGANGMGWNAGAPGADMCALTSQQKIGPDNATNPRKLVQNKGWHSWQHCQRGYLGSSRNQGDS